MLLQSQARVIALGILLFSSLLVTHGFSQGKFGGLGLPTVGPNVSYEASYEVEKGGGTGRLSVTAKVSPGSHTYSITQPPDGPLATSIKIINDFVKVKEGAFIPDREPHIGHEDIWPGVPVEEYDKFVTWTAPFEFSKEFEPDKSELMVRVDGLVCGNGSCMPVGGKLTAKFAGYYGAIVKVELLRVDTTHAEWRAKLRPSQVQPGATAILELSATLDEGYHIYRYVPNDAETQFRTLIVAKTKSGLKFGAAHTDAHFESTEGLDKPVEYYAEQVTWEIPIRVPETARQGELPIEVMVGFLTCNEGSCDLPAGLMVSGNLTVASESNAEARVFSLSEVDYRVVAEAPNLATWVDADGDEEQLVASDPGSIGKQEPAQSLTLIHILAALAGGFILNFMPCVLPVIGLKVMSFVNQAGNKHSQMVNLNLAFVGGILGVMLVLALATVLAKVVWGSAFGWGEQFTVLEFKVALAALVFAMALSFLGVWEIPIPGFAMSSKSGELMQKEGPWGAFLKGVLTTVLATPCSGPLLGSLFGLSLSLSPVNVVFLYLLVGLGMSLPYLALCFYPGFIKLLPRPGAWMETLKQILAFPLLLTVVFFVASIDDGHRIATLILLIVVWFACWLVGRVPAYSDRGRIWTAWLSGAATIALGAFVSFSFFGPLHSELPWVPYNEVHLARHRQDGKTVMIDFTANWCLNCQLNTRFAIERKRVADLVAQNQVVPMLADWTERSEDIRGKLEDLNSNSIPLLVIYPADPNAAPILLRDVLTESQVLEALKQAGPSLPKSKLTSTTLP